MKKVIVLFIFLVLGIGLTLLYRRFEPEAKKELVLYGNVDIREVNLGFRVNGKLAALQYDEGDWIKAGDMLAKLDAEPYLNQLANAKAQAESIRQKLKLYETGNRPQEIEQASLLLREREVTFNNAKLLFERSEKTLDFNGVSIQERDNAKANYQEAEARFKSAKQNLSLLQAGFRVEQIAQTKAELAQAEAVLASAQLQVQDTVLTAPSNGVILTRAQEIGTILSSGSVVYTLSLQNPVWVRAYIHETELGLIHSGRDVLIYTDTHPDQPYKGKIGYISPRAEFTPKNVETTQLRPALVYRIRIIVDNSDASLKQGMPVTVKLSNDNAA